jgi:hypothetical protein
MWCVIQHGDNCNVYEARSCYIVVLLSTNYCELLALNYNLKKHVFIVHSKERQNAVQSDEE